MHSESLQELLVSLRQHTSPLAAIPALPALRRGAVIEIQGPASSGKTHLVYHILSSFLVPVDPDPGASEIAAVVYDTDASFDMERFRRLLLSRTSRLPSSTLGHHEHVRQSLARLHVFRPASLSQLAASIAHLPAYHASNMPNQEIAVLAIDSISTFYWPDRFAAEQMRNLVPEKAKMLPLHHVFNAIQSLRRSHGPLTVLTNWSLSSPPKHSASLYDQHLHIREDAVADLGAKVLRSADRPSSSPSRLAHHIALSFPPSDSSPDDALIHGTHNPDNGQLSCLMSSSGSRHTLRFTVQITDDDVLVCPQQPTEQTV